MYHMWVNSHTHTWFIRDLPCPGSRSWSPSLAVAPSECLQTCWGKPPGPGCVGSAQSSWHHDAPSGSCVWRSCCLWTSGRPPAVGTFITVEYQLLPSGSLHTLLDWRPTLVSEWMNISSATSALTAPVQAERSKDLDCTDLWHLHCQWLPLWGFFFYCLLQIFSASLWPFASTLTLKL